MVYYGQSNYLHSDSDLHKFKGMNWYPWASRDSSRQGPEEASCNPSYYLDSRQKSYPILAHEGTPAKTFYSQPFEGLYP